MEFSHDTSPAGLRRDLARRGTTEWLVLAAMGLLGCLLSLFGVLTDEKLPGLSGTGLTARIKALRPDIPVIVMSGFGGDGLADRLAQAGVSELLHKPLVARDIAQALHRALHRST